MALDNPFDFTGKTALLAGATGGLGHLVTRAFAKAGANIGGCVRNGAALDKLAAELKGSTGGVLMEEVDLCDEKQVAGFVGSTRKRFGRVGVLVTLVGNIIRKPSVDYSLDEWQQVVDANLNACWLTCQSVGRVMIAQKGGRIIIYASNAGLHGIPGCSAYSPAKAGVIALTRGLAVEWGPHGITPTRCRLDLRSRHSTRTCWAIRSGSNASLRRTPHVGSMDTPSTSTLASMRHNTEEFQWTRSG